MRGEAPMVRFFACSSGRVVIRIHGHLMHGPGCVYLLTERSVARAGKFLENGSITAEGDPSLRCAVSFIAGHGWAVTVK